MNLCPLIILLQPDTYIYILWALLIVLSLAAFFVCRCSRCIWLKCLFVIPVCVSWPLFIYGAYIGVNQLEVRRLNLSFPDLPSSFDGYTIVHFSDVHAGTISCRQRQLLERAVDSINAVHADLVVFTGDLQNKRPSEIDTISSLLSKIKARDGVFSVMGNHDYPIYLDDEYEIYTDMGTRFDTDRQLGWHLLVNGHYPIKRGSDVIHIAGMDNDSDNPRFPQRGDLNRTLSGLSVSDFIIMLEHDPSAWRRKILPHSHVQLTLSGHTHGGQFSLFGWSPASLVFKEYNGLYSIGKRYINVTSGLSGVVPIRVGTPPEIVVITLRSSVSEDQKDKTL